MNVSKPLYLLLSTIVIIGIATNYFACATKDKCNNVVCLNNGSCNSGNCVCLTGFQGPRCDSLSRDKFISVYHGGDSCDYVLDSPGVYRQYANSIRLTANIIKPLELVMTNFLDNPLDSAVCTMVAVDSFTFLGANNSTTYNGTGWLRNDSLFMHYHVIHDTTSYDCNYLGLRY